MIGGGGKRVLSIAARSADIVGVNPNLKAGAIGAETVNDALAVAVDQKLEWVRAAAGDRFDDIELNMLSFVAEVTDDSAGFAAILSDMFGAPAEDILEVPAVVVGSLEEIRDTLESRRDRWGFSYYVFQGDAAEKMAPVVASLTGN